MYNSISNLVLGFHGCDMNTMKKVLIDGENLMSSNNTYDWLGNGVYFWENSLSRAQEWAENHCERHNRKYPDEPPLEPAVIGAVIDLGYCLNFTDYGSAKILKHGYDILKYEFDSLNKELPRNRDVKNNTDKLFRDLDCAVIQRIHKYNSDEKLREYDSVRGVFIEGNPIYENAGIMEKTHTQICIVNPNCIKGYFKPLLPNEKFNKV